MATRDEITDALKANARKRKELEVQLAELRKEADEIIVAGDKVGVPKLTLSQAGALTRQTVYMILLRSKAAA